MKQREFDRLRAEIENEYRRKIEALNIVWKMASDKPTNGSGKTGLTKIVRDFVRNAAHTFTTKDVSKAVVVHIPTVKRTAISIALKRMIDKEIIVVTPGSGRSPTIYKKA